MAFTVRQAHSGFYGRIGSPPPVVARIPRRRPPGADGEATLRWGAPGVFQFAAGGGGFAVTQPIFDILPSGDAAEEDDAALGLVFTETGRQVSVVRVTNPSDPADFVDVEVIDRISFRGPDGLIRTFVLNN
jgi:hypothetical protein